MTFVGTAFLFVAVLDLFHTLTYRGMGVFPDISSSNIPTQLWISARYLEALSLAAAPLLVGRRLKTVQALTAFALVTAALLLAIFVWPVFPDAFLEETGLTPFKITSEYIISALFILAAGITYRFRRPSPGTSPGSSWAAWC